MTNCSDICRAIPPSCLLYVALNGLEDERSTIALQQKSFWVWVLVPFEKFLGLGASALLAE